MKKLVEEFNTKYPKCHAVLSKKLSKTFRRHAVLITDQFDFTDVYLFKTVADFKKWIDGIPLYGFEKPW